MTDRITTTYPLLLQPGCAIQVGGKWAVVRNVIDTVTVEVVPYSWWAKAWWTMFGKDWTKP